MSKTICVALCVILGLFLVANAQTMKIEWVESYALQGEWNQVRITTTNVNMALNPSFTPSLIKAEREATTPPVKSKWEFDTPTYPIPSQFGLTESFGRDGSNFGCVDQTTGQSHFLIKVDSDKITIVVRSENWYDQYYNFQDSTKFGDFVLLCPIWLKSDDSLLAVPQTDNLLVTIPVDGVATNDIVTDQAFPLPTEGWVTPHLVFKSLSLKQKDTQDRASTTTVDVQFTANKNGRYYLSVVNGPSFATYDWSELTPVQLWCSAGSNKQFARVWISGGSATVFVTKADEKQVIKCQLPLNNEEDIVFVRSERTSVKISYGYNEELSVAKTVDFSLLKEYAEASANANGATLNVYVSTTSAIDKSANPINTNSTMVFKFSKHINVARLTLPQSQQGYREGLMCVDGDHGYFGTVFVNAAANTITLKDVQYRMGSGFSDNKKIDCIFNFNGSEAFHFDNQSKMGSVELIIDGRAVSSLYGTGTASPLYITSAFNVGLISQDIQLNSGTYNIVDRFSIADDYTKNHVTPTEPVVFLALSSGAQMFTHEDHGKQVTCQISSPTSTALVDLKLVWDVNTLTWSAPLKDLVDLETFNIVLECKYSRQQIMKYGFDWTPTPFLSVEVIDLIDGKRFITNSDTSSPSQVIEQLVNGSTEVPAKPELFIRAHSTSLFAKAIDYTTAKSIADQFATDTVELYKNRKDTDGDLVYPDYTLTPVLSAGYTFGSTSSNYVNFTSANTLRHFDLDVLKNEFFPSDFNIDTLGIFNRISSTDPYVNDIKMAQVQVDQLYNVKKSSAWAPSEADSLGLSAPNDFTQANIAKVLGQDAVGVVAPNTDATFWASPITACGYMNGLQVKSSNQDADFEWKTDTTPNYNTAFVNRVTCSVNESCTVNADCSGTSMAGATVCSLGKCTVLPKKIAPFISIDSTRAKALDKLYFNSAQSTSLIAVVGIVVAAFLF